MKSSVDDFLKNAEMNKKLVLFMEKNLPRGGFFRWSFVILYYTAHAYFCAFLLNRGDRIPEAHADRGLDRGDINLALDKFWRQEENGSVYSVGELYKDLYDWGFIVRYKPCDARILSKENLKLAISHLEEIKNLAVRDIGFSYKYNISKRKFTRRSIV